MSLSQDLEKARQALIEDGMKIKSWAAGEVSGRDYTSLSKEEKENVVKEIAKIVFKGNDLVSPVSCKLIFTNFCLLYYRLLPVKS